MPPTSTQHLAQQTIRGLYGITPDIADAPQIPLLLAHIEAALCHGLKLLQLRNKSLPSDQLHTLGKQVRQLCTQYQATLIVNDSLALAQAIEADGVHLGKADCSLATARQQLTSKQMIGISCYDQLSLAAQASQATQHGIDDTANPAPVADYVAFGSLFPSRTKPNAVRAAPDLLTQAQQFKIPCVAIGGITRQNAHIPLKAGAQAIAVISDLFGYLTSGPHHTAASSNTPEHTAQRTQEWLAIIRPFITPIQPLN